MVYRKKKISVILPCRNEGSHLPEVIKRIPAFVDEIIVVSNKSTDDTVKVAKKLGLKVYEDNRAINGIGYGFAHITGIENATGDIIVGIDGDATYPIEKLASIINYIDENNLDFVSCNRYPMQDGSKISLKLKTGVKALNIETRLLYGIKVKDILSGMWVFKKEVKNQLKLTMGDWNLSPQIKINAALNPTVKYSEFSIVQHTRQGTTKQHYFVTGVSHLTWLFTNRLGIRKFPKIDK
ncbi:MAG TPA: glycosyltransferase family 2 protein [Candidatus Saccharimonadales bacterium]|nr:glycosyltransferase family 2 protein [Candidatus Saccharimonadales bacterium]